jgi:hypothetical protein
MCVEGSISPPTTPITPAAARSHQNPTPLSFTMGYRLAGYALERPPRKRSAPRIRVTFTNTGAAERSLINYGVAVIPGSLRRENTGPGRRVVLLDK